MKKSLILVVNYNKKIEQAETIKSLLSYNFKLKEKYDVFIWDNIPKDDNKNIIKELENYLYKSSINNNGLAYIYNYVISNLVLQYEYLIIFDNDSTVKIEYFEEFEKIKKLNKNINLFVPRIIYQDIIRSPRKIENYIFKKSKHTFYEKTKSGLIECKDLFIANSGMIIKSEYLVKKFKKYDERLKFYGTDDYFIKKYNKFNNKFYLLDYTLEHDFSLLNQNESIDKKIFRFKDVLNGINIMKEDENIFMCKRMSFSMLKNAVSRSFQDKDIRYLKVYFEVILKQNKKGEV